VSIQDLSIWLPFFSSLIAYSIALKVHCPGLYMYTIHVPPKYPCYRGTPSLIVSLLKVEHELYTVQHRILAVIGRCKICIALFLIPRSFDRIIDPKRRKYWFSRSSMLSSSLSQHVQRVACNSLFSTSREMALHVRDNGEDDNKHGGLRRVKLTQYLSRISLYKVKIRGLKKSGSKTPPRQGDFPRDFDARVRDVGL